MIALSQQSQLWVITSRPPPAHSNLAQSRRLKWITRHSLSFFFPPSRFTQQRGHWGIGQGSYDASLLFFQTGTLQQNWALPSTHHYHHHHHPPQSINISLIAFRKAAQRVEMLKRQIWWNRVGSDRIYWLFLGNADRFITQWVQTLYLILKWHASKDDPVRLQIFNTSFRMSWLKYETLDKLTPAKFISCSLSSATQCGLV